ncbi:MAG TPA: class A beta-lactamase-related serine hydrolase [Planctomycetaceae bacterium]|nr:class A beta-lactamase-related serine hydrolase [Planctomycetaceae bacterium]
MSVPSDRYSKPIIRFHTFQLLLTSLVFLGSPSFLVGQQESLEDAVQTAVKMEAERQNAVGVAVGVLIDGKIAFYICTGYQDQEAHIPVSRSTMFRWASISKSLTAITLLQLAEQEILSLDQTVNHFLVNYPAQQTSDGKSHEITLEQLLTHQSGIVHYTNGVVKGTPRSYLRPHPYRHVQLALNGFNQSLLVHVPGTAYSYTTRGYILLSAIVEQTTDRPFHIQVDRMIAKPLGMNTLQPDYQWKRIQNRAVGYRKLTTGKIVPSSDTDVSWKLGGGGFISNIDDLAKFAEGLLQRKLVSQETQTMMFTRRAIADGTTTNYGLGFQSQELNGRQTVGHGGSQEKTKTRLAIDLESNSGVVLMSNSEYVDTAKFAEAIFKAIADNR